jgi:PHP family Zn ribbon phosphoesterase
LQGATKYIFCIAPKTEEYQLYKRLMACYNQDNESAKLGLAIDDDTLYLVEYPMNILNGKIRRKQYVCNLG